MEKQTNFQRNLILPEKWRSCRGPMIGGCFLFILVVAGLWLAIIFGVILRLDTSKPAEDKVPERPILPPCAGQQKIYKHAAVTSNQPHCSEIGREILEKKGGSVVDAAIAVQLCLGVMNLHSSGIGGNMLMTYYKKSEDKAYVLDALGTVGHNASTHVLGDVKYFHDNDAQRVTVPSQIRGFHMAHKTLGKLPWKDLFQPAIVLAKGGFHLTGDAYEAFKANRAKGSFLNRHISGDDVPKFGDTVKLPLLGRTLEQIATGGADVFYNGSLTGKIVDDIQRGHGVISKEDLNNYKAKWLVPLKYKTDQGDIYTTPPPSSGIIVHYILQIMKALDFKLDTLKTARGQAIFTSYMLEAMKYAFGQVDYIKDPASGPMKEFAMPLYSEKRAKNDGEKIVSKTSNEYYPNSLKPSTVNYLYPSDATHVSIIGPNGDAIAMTSSLGDVFGSGNEGSLTGILFNHAHSYGPSALPGFRPYTTMSPVLVVKDTDVIISMGATGGASAVTATVGVLERTLFIGDGPKYAIDFPRVHHQLVPDTIYFDHKLNKDLRQELINLGYKTRNDDKMEKTGNQASVQMIMKWHDKLLSYGDMRRVTCVNGY